MSPSRLSLSGLAAAITLGALAAGCGTIGGFGLGDSKQAVASSPDYPERPKLVMPAPNAPLPVPGQAAAAQPQWSATTQQPNQQASAAPAEQQSSGGWFSGIFGSKTQ